MEGQIRKQRQETLYRQRERRQKFIEWVVIITSVITGVAILAIFVWLFKFKDQ
jgi:ABC-type phosphate transport system permease subunit